MKKRFEPIEVETDADEIRITQQDGINEPSVIIITPEQIPLLREAEAELETSGS